MLPYEIGGLRDIECRCPPPCGVGLATGGLDDWARADALPSEAEISKVKDLIHRVRDHLDDLSDAERAALDEAVTVVRRARQLTHLGMPQIRPPRPDLRLERP